MLISGDPPITIDATTIEVIAERVIAVLRHDLEGMAAELAGAGSPGEQLTVEQVARRLGVARSTVYAHWREWGGYKLGASHKAPIRFDTGALPVVKPRSESGPALTADAESRVPRKPRRRRRDLVIDAPRFDGSLDEVL
jgi:transposase-like protein